MKLYFKTSTLDYHALICFADNLLTLTLHNCQNHMTRGNYPVEDSQALVACQAN